jgi:A/G-specific adenine glycosylase
VVVDANIERLMARLFAIAVPLPAGKANIRTAMDVLTPKNGAGDFAQACMDIGATICTARLPKCPQCPVQMHCEAFLTGTPEHFPVKPAKKAKPLRRGRFFWIEQDGHVLLVTRPNTGMLGGMRALPDDNWSAAADGEAFPPMTSQWTIVPDIIQHSFTHFTLCVDLAVYRGPKLAKANRIGEWWPLESWDKAGLPTLYAKTIRRWMMIRNEDDND